MSPIMMRKLDLAYSQSARASQSSLSLIATVKPLLDGSPEAGGCQLAKNQSKRTKSLLTVLPVSCPRIV